MSFQPVTEIMDEKCWKSLVYKIPGTEWQILAFQDAKLAVEIHWNGWTGSSRAWILQPRSPANSNTVLIHSSFIMQQSYSKIQHRLKEIQKHVVLAGK